MAGLAGRRAVHGDFGGEIRPAAELKLGDPGKGRYLTSKGFAAGADCDNGNAPPRTDANRRIRGRWGPRR
jgi:hypothetical protein